MIGKLILEDNTIIEGRSFGANVSVAGEVVFATGMTGYPESLTDPSYKGQILILTYPLIGNYGVPDKKYWESDGIKVCGLIVSNYIDTPSHFQSKQTLGLWLRNEKIPALEIADTRFLTQKIRVKGTCLGKIIVDDPEESRKVNIDFYDPNKENLVAQVSTKKTFVLTPETSTWYTPAYTPGVNYVHTSGKRKKILLFDCGTKQNIIRSLLKRNVEVVVVPWDFDPFDNDVKLNFDAVIISNGPGDPKKADKTILNIRKVLQRKIPTLGICLGNQLLALAGGGDTQKLKFGHRSQNQPCLLEDPPSLGEAGSQRCYITTQNHGFAVSKIPKGFKAWFTNANDGSNEGIIHNSLPVMSVQFHPEANPGPVDTAWIFDYFLERVS